MLISELAAKTQLPSHTIRFYEREGLIDERFIERSANNYRHYTEDAVERVLMIRHGQSAGFTLSEIRMLLDAWDLGVLNAEEQAVYIDNKLLEISEKIAELDAIRRYLTDKLQKLRAPAPAPNSNQAVAPVAEA